jgi:hypothetical protein
MSFSFAVTEKGRADARRVFLNTLAETSNINYDTKTVIEESTSHLLRVAATDDTVTLRCDGHVNEDGSGNLSVGIIVRKTPEDVPNVHKPA